MAKIATISVPGAKALYSKTVLDANFSAVNNNFLNFLHLDGASEASNSMTGVLDMGGKEVINSVTPSAPDSLATKGYVDQTLTIGSTVGTIGSLIVDADGDTKIDTETSADIDRLDLLAATSGGGSAGIRIVGNDAAASSLDNPNVEIKKHVVLDPDVRIGDAVAANTYLELTDTTKTDTILAVAGGNAVLDLTATEMLVSQHIEMAVGKRIGDLDNDTYIEFNQVSDDDTVRIFAGGVEKATFTSSTVSLDVDSNSGNFAFGGSVNPTGATKSLQLITGTGATTAADLIDNQVNIFSSIVTGIENKLSFDFKQAGPLRSTVVLGDNCVFPNDVSVGNDLTVTGAMLPTTVGGTIGGTPTITSAWIFSGVPVFSGATSFTGAPVFSGIASFTSNPTFSGVPVFSNNPSFTGLPTFTNVGAIPFSGSIQVDTIDEKGSAAGVTIEGTLVKDNSISILSGGIKTDTGGTNELLRTKVIAIGDWDMVATISVQITHSLTIGKIRSVSALIRDDTVALTRPLIQSTSSGTLTMDSTKINLARTIAGVFDSTDFDSTSFNRGWITILYAV